MDLLRNWACRTIIILFHSTPQQSRALPLVSLSCPVHPAWCPGLYWQGCSPPENKHWIYCVMRKINKRLFGKTFAQAYFSNITTIHFELWKTVCRCRCCCFYSVNIIQPLSLYSKCANWTVFLGSETVKERERVNHSLTTSSKNITKRPRLPPQLLVPTHQLLSVATTPDWLICGRKQHSTNNCIAN